MKRIALFLALAAALFSCAAALCLAEDEGNAPRAGIVVACPAQEDGTIPLYAEPSEESPVRMRYFSGAVLRAVAPADGGFWQVSCGPDGAQMTGYALESDLRFGAKAERSVPRRLRNFDCGVELDVYSAPAGEYLCRSNPYHVTLCGITDDGWGQLWDLASSTGGSGDWKEGDTAGFVHALCIDDWPLQYVDPAEDELSYDEAFLRATEYVAAQAGEIDFLPDDLTLERVQAMRALVSLAWLETEQRAWWEVYFLDDEFEVYLEPDGALIDIHQAHG